MQNNVEHEGNERILMVDINFTKFRDKPFRHYLKFDTFQ